MNVLDPGRGWRLACAGAAFIGAAGVGAAGAQDGGEDNELDRFMQQVVTRRDENRPRRRQYVFDEVERFAVTGPDGEVYRTFTREYVWYERDGVFVRSPVRIDGVATSEAEWRRYEVDWLAAEARRAGDASAPAAGWCAAGAGAASDADPALGATAGREWSDRTATADLQPRFLSESYWLELEFEPGNYYFAGRERLAGRDVLRIEYYPERLFGGQDEGDAKCGGASAIPVPGAHEALNKGALVTLWIDPAEHQIVRFAFDNTGFDFLPLRWLIRLDDLTASMTMGRPLDSGVWLPERIEAAGVMTMASGSATVTYSRTFSDYRRPRTGGRLRPLAPPRP